MSKENRVPWLAFIAVGAFILIALLLSSNSAENEYTGTHAATVVPTPPASRPRTVAQASAPLPSLGPGASLHGKRLFPLDNPWNQDISNSPLDPNSANLTRA